MTRGDGDEVVVRRRIGKPAGCAYGLWVTPDSKRLWWGVTEGGELVECVTEAWVGGRVAYAMRPRDSEGPIDRIEGRMVEVSPNRRLVFTWAWTGNDAPAMATTVDVTFIDEGSSCEVVVRHSGQPDARIADVHRRGWTNKLADLEIVAAARSGPE